jgi:hypothetical protein
MPDRYCPLCAVCPLCGFNRMEHVDYFENVSVYSEQYSTRPVRAYGQVPSRVIPNARVVLPDIDWAPKGITGTSEHKMAANVGLALQQAADVDWVVVRPMVLREDGPDKLFGLNFECRRDNWQVLCGIPTYGDVDQALAALIPRVNHSFASAKWKRYAQGIALPVLCPEKQVNPEARFQRLREVYEKGPTFTLGPYQGDTSR